MFSKTYLITLLAGFVLQMMPQIEAWAVAAVSFLIAELTRMARNHAVSEAVKGKPTKALPVIGAKALWSKG